jgi:hypothetical protein
MWPAAPACNMKGGSAWNTSRFDFFPFGETVSVDDRFAHLLTVHLKPPGQYFAISSR